jgi:hypothetical protein
VAGQLPVVVFDDIELWACGYLRPLIAARPEPYTDDVLVSNEIPKDPDTGEHDRRDRMVIVRRDGGSRIRRIFDQPRLSIDVWATTKDDAIDLARMVCAFMGAAPGDGQVKSVDQTSGPTRIAEPSGQPRVYCTFNILTKGSDLS